MEATDPTIDPITGLPLLNPQDVIQQIPLGVQTFPYEDMQATARPTRNPMYGDDILPTSAFVAGQHPSTGSAQTVETDGAHAAKVFVVNGGGGGNPTPIALKTDGQGYGVCPVGAFISVSLADTPRAIYGILCTWDIDNVDLPGNGGWVQFGLVGSVSGNLMIYYQESLVLLDAGTTNDVRGSAYVPFNPPISVALMGWLGGGGAVQTYIVNETQQTLDVAMLVYYDV